MFLLLKTLCTMVAIWNDVFSIDYQKLFTQAHICTSFLLSFFKEDKLGNKLRYSTPTQKSTISLSFYFPLNVCKEYMHEQGFKI